jgi:excisionase family DNA binding protein
METPMRTLTLIPTPQRINPVSTATSRPGPHAARHAPVKPSPLSRVRRAAVRFKRVRGVSGGGFTPLIDAKAAGEMLGVPHTWLLAQARAGRIPHHRLGHYVRFNTHDLDLWLKDTRRGPAPRTETVKELGR